METLVVLDKKALTTQQVAERFNQLAQEEKWFEIQDELFAENVKSIEPSTSRSRACPLPGLSTHLPPLRRGRDSRCRGNLKLVLSLPQQRGGSSPEGGEGGALDLALKLQDHDRERAAFRVCRPTFPRCAGEGTAGVAAIWNSCCRCPRNAGAAPPKGVRGGLLCWA